MGGISEEFGKPSATPHDAAFKAAFQKKELAKSFFRRFLPKAIVQQIDFRHMKLNNRSYVDEAMRDTLDRVPVAVLQGEPVAGISGSKPGGQTASGDSAGGFIPWSEALERTEVLFRDQRPRKRL